MQYELPTELDPRSKQRVKEIKFYLFMQQLFNAYQRSNPAVMTLLEILSRLFGCRMTLINVVVATLNSPLYEPTKVELVVASRYLNISVRKFQKLTGISSNTYYSKLNEYIENNCIALAPRLTQEQFIETERFMSKAKDMFSNISEVLKYDENRI